MIRFAALAAVAAVAIAQPAAAQPAAEIRVSLVGKSEAQIQKDVADAARSVCRFATSGETFRLAGYNACVRDTVKVTLDKI